MSICILPASCIITSNLEGLFCKGRKGSLFRCHSIYIEYPAEKGITQQYKFSAQVKLQRSWVRLVWVTLVSVVHRKVWGLTLVHLWVKITQPAI